MTYLKHVVAVCCLMILFQVMGKPQDEPVRVETNLVNIGVVVTDKKGERYPGLQKGQFEVYDNSVRQEIALFSNEDSPVSFGVVYDLHPMSSERTKIVLEALKRFTAGLRREDDFFIILFNQNGNLDLDFVPPLEQVERHLSSKNARGADSLYDAVFMASEKLRAKKNLKRSLIVISDAAHHYSHHSFSELSRSLKSFNVQIYALILTGWRWWDYSDITIGTRVRRWPWDPKEIDRASLKDLAAKSGGSAETPFSESALTFYEILDEASKNMRRQYTLGFYPEKTDGKWHKVKVIVRDPKTGKKLPIEYRRGYQNPVSVKQ